MSSNGRRPQSASSAGRRLLDRYQAGLAAVLQNDALAPDADSSTDSAGSVDYNAHAVIKKTSTALGEYLKELSAHNLPAELRDSTSNLRFQLQSTLQELDSLGSGTLIGQENFRQAQITEAQRFNEHVQRLKEENQRLRDENKRLKEQGSENVDPNVARELQIARDECRRTQEAHDILEAKLNNILTQHEQQMKDLNEGYTRQLEAEREQNERILQEASKYKRENDQLKRQVQGQRPQEDLEQWQQAYERLHGEHEQLREDYQHALDTETTLREQLSTLAEELQNAQQQHEQQPAASQDELEEAYTRIQELQAEVTRLEAENGQLQDVYEQVNQLEDAANQIDELKAQVAELEGARQRVVELEQQLQALRTHAAASEELEQHQAAIDHLATELANAQTLLAEEKKRAATTASDLKAAQDKIAQQEVIINSNIRQNEAMQQSLEEARTTAETMRQRLQRAQTEADSLREQLETQKNITEQLRLTVGELDDQNKELAKQVGVKSQPQTPVHEPGSLAGYLGEPATPSANVEQLEQELEDLRAEVADLQAALREAQSKEMDYCHELERLQAEMIIRVGEAEQGQEDALYDGVNLHVNLATKEDVIRHYRIQLAKLEAANLKLDELLTEANQELAAEKDLNVVLKEFISKVAQKDDVSEQLLKEMEQERDLLEQQQTVLQRSLEETKAKLAEQKDQSEAQQAELEKLQQALVEKITTLQQSERDFDAQKQLLEDSIGKYHQELQRRNQLLEAEMQAKGNLAQRYEELQQHHDVLISQSEGDTDTLERMRNYIDAMRATTEKQKDLTNSIVRHVTAYQAWFTNKSSQLEREVKLAIAALHRRMNHLATVVSIVKSMRRSHQQEVATLQARLAEATSKVHQLQASLDTERASSTHTSGDVAGLRAALDVKNARIRELEQELEEAVRTESKLRREITGLEAAVQDAEDRSATASLNSAARGQLQHDGSNKHAQLDERLTALEQSLLDVSAQAARHFATRTREVAMLDAEKIRAKKLIDHLRVMNAKLMGDLNDARQRATEAQFLGYRLEVANEAQKAAEEKCARLQRALEQREAETLRLLQQAKSADPQLTALYEQQLADARQQVAALQTALAEAQAETEDTRQKLERAVAGHKTRETALDTEVHRLQRELESKTDELRRLRAHEAQSFDDKALRIAELEAALQTAKRLNSQLEEQLAQTGMTEARLQELMRDKASLAQKLQTAQEALQDAQDQVQDREDEIHGLQQELQQRNAEEAKVRDADTQKVGELRMLRERTAALVEQRDKLNNELAESWKQAHNLKAELDMKTTQLETAQQRLKALSEAEQSREAELHRLRQAQSDLQRTLDVKEQRLAAAQGDLEAARREANVQGEAVRELKQRNQTLQTQVAAQQAELAEYRSHVDEHRGNETKITQELARIKEEKRQAIAQLAELDSALRELRSEQSTVAGRLRNSLFDIERENPRLALLSSNVDAVDPHSLHALVDKMMQCISTMNVQMDQLRAQAADGSAHAKEVLSLQKRLRDVKAEADARAQQQMQLFRQQLDANERALQDMRNERDDANMQMANLQSQLRTVRRQLDSILLVQMKDMDERARQVLGATAPGTLSEQHSAISFGDHSDLDDSRDTMDLVVVHRQLAGGLDDSELPDDDILDAKMKQLTDGLAYALRAMTTAAVHLEDHQSNLHATAQEKLRAHDRAMEAEAALSEMKLELQSARNQLELEQQKVERLESRVARLREDHADTQKQLTDAVRECQDLRHESRTHADGLAELRRTVTAAQEQAREKQARASELQTQLSDTLAELDALRRQHDVIQSKLSDAELEVENKNAQLKRLQADYHASQAARTQLQLEVDRQRKELAEYRGSASSLAEGEASSAWVLQRLLTQLQSLFNQLRLDLDLDGWAESKDASTRLTLREADSSNRLDSSARGEWLMKVLQLAAARAREIRVECDRITDEHRQCDNKLLAAEAKTDLAKRAAEALQASKDELEDVVREKERSIGLLEHKLSGRDVELEVSRTRYQDLQSQYNKLRDEHQQQQLQSGTDAAELKRLRARLQQFENRESALNAEMSPMLHELSAAKKRLEERDKELKSVKLHNNTLQAQFDALSQELTDARNSAAALRATTAELERLRIEHSATNSKVDLLNAQLEAKEQEVARWKESTGGRYQALADDLQRVQAEKRALQDQLVAVTLERDRLEKDVLRWQSEVDQLRQQLTDRSRQGLEATYSDLRGQLAAAEEARNALSQKVATQNKLLKKLQEQVARYAQEKEEAQKTDEALQKSLMDTTAAWRRTAQQLDEAKQDRERALAEVKSVTQQRDTLAQEVGRVSHELDKSKRWLSELTNAVTDPSLNLPAGAVSPTGHGVERDPVSTVQQILVAFKALSRERADLLSRYEAMKRDCQQLQHDLEGLQALHTQRERQYRAELNSLEDQLTLARQGDSRSVAELQATIAGLRSQLEQERDAKHALQTSLTKEQAARDRAAEEIRGLREQVEAGNRAAAQLDASELRQARQAADRLSRELQQAIALQQAQRDAINALENRIRRQTERLAELQSREITSRAHPSYADETKEPELALRGRLERQNIRNEVLEDIVSIYRSALTNNQVPESTDADNTYDSSSTQIPLYKLLEQEIKRMIELHAQETRITNCELLELRGRIAHQEVYVEELQKQVRQSSNALYHGGKSNLHEMANLENRRLRDLLKQEQESRQRLENEFARLKQAYQEKQAAWMADLVRATQARDVALRTAAQVELEFASSRQAQEAANREAEHYKSKASAQKKDLVELQKQLQATEGELAQLQRTVENLRLNLNERDEQVRSLERKYRRLKAQGMAAEPQQAEQTRSRGSSRSGPTEARYDLGTTGAGSAYMRVTRGDRDGDLDRTLQENYRSGGLGATRPVI